MTYRRYQISRGSNPRGPAAIVESVGSAISSGSLEVTIDFNAVRPIQSKREAVALLNAIAERIARGNWPPA